MTRGRNRAKRRPRSLFLRGLKRSLRGNILRGMLVVVPLGVTAYIVVLCYYLTAGHLVPLLRQYTGEMPGYAIVTLSIVLFLAFVYLTGLVASLVVGRRLIALGESILRHIPLVKTIYGASRQVVDVLSRENEGETYQAAVMVPFPSTTSKAIAFVTGKLRINDEPPVYRVFVPTTPNPTSGYLEFYPVDEVDHTSITVEEAVKTVMSAGILTPEHIEVSEAPSSETSPRYLSDAAAEGRPAPRKLIPKRSWKSALLHVLRKPLISGLLVLIPVGITVFVLDFVYTLTAGRVAPITRFAVGHFPAYVNVVASVLFLLALLYLAGYVATDVLGRRLIRLMELFIARVPLITTVYGATKQIVATLIDPASGPKFQAPVLVRFPHRGARTIGFLVGHIDVGNNGRYYKVFVPTTPNVTIGLLEFFAPDDITGCSLTLEEAIKLVVSGGIIGPDAIATCPLPGMIASRVHEDR